MTILAVSPKPLAKRFNASEDRGALTGITAQYLVQTDHASGALSPSERIREILDSTSIPQYGDVPNGDTNVVCTNRTVSLERDGENNNYIVDIEYTPVGELQAGWIFRFSSTLQQFETTRDIGGVPIELSYTDAATGETKTQGASVTAQGPFFEAETSGIVQVDFPLLWAAKYESFLNSAQWFGGAPGTWLCADVQQTLHNRNTTPASWIMTVRFQYDPSGWDPTAVAVDPETGQPPPDLVLGQGIKTVITYPRTDFNEQWPSPLPDENS